MLSLRRNIQVGLPNFSLKGRFGKQPSLTGGVAQVAEHLLCKLKALSWLHYLRESVTEACLKEPPHRQLIIAEDTVVTTQQKEWEHDWRA
jgi:hypothetical protein